MSDCRGGDWKGKLGVWHYRDQSTEEGVSVELIDVSTRQARVKIYSSFTKTVERIVAKGSSVIAGNNYIVKCIDVTKTMQMAKVSICLEDDPTPPPTPTPPTPPTPDDIISPGETVVVDGHTFTLISMVCGTNARIVATVDGVLQSTTMKAVVGGFIAMLPLGGVAVGGLYVAAKIIAGRCTLSLDNMAGGGLTPKDQEDNERRAGEEYVDPEGNPASPEEIEAADEEAEERTANWLNVDYVEKVQQLTSGTITQRVFDKWLKDTTYNLKLVILDEGYYRNNFTINIPSIVLAGDIDVSGDAPKQNVPIQIVAVKKLLGFDLLAADTVLATPTSCAKYVYATTIPLYEFGVVEVYARIPKDWWEVLDADVVSAKTTVLVVTPMILLALLAILAMVVEKKYNYIGIFKKGGKKK